MEYYTNEVNKAKKKKKASPCMQRPITYLVYINRWNPERQTKHLQKKEKKEEIHPFITLPPRKNPILKT